MYRLQGHSVPRVHPLGKLCGGAGRAVAPSTVMQAGSSAPPHTKKVVGFGSCCVDYLASVATYPKPDEKLRTLQLEVQGGGNCANALTAAARLGVAPVIVTKVGGDGLGDGMISELERDAVGTQFVLRAAGMPSPFTYIIVDQAGGTRTCIHTPGANLEPNEMTHELLQQILEGAALVYFDGRLTEAALKLAEAARQAGIPVLVEGERLRAHLDKLLALADYVVTSQNYPKDATGEADPYDAMLALSERLPAARFLLTTMGTQGAVLLERQGGQPPQQAVCRSLSAVMEELKEQLAAAAQKSEGLAAVSVTGVTARSGVVAQTSEPCLLTYSSPGRATPAVPLYAHVSLAATAALPQGAVVDTTGAGDSFIGSVLYGLSTGLPREKMLRLAALVAGLKCTALGARAGLPLRASLPEELLV